MRAKRINRFYILHMIKRTLKPGNKESQNYDVWMNKHKRKTQEINRVTQQRSKEEIK